MKQIMGLRHHLHKSFGQQPTTLLKNTYNNCKLCYTLNLLAIDFQWWAVVGTTILLNAFSFYACSILLPVSTTVFTRIKKENPSRVFLYEVWYSWTCNFLFQSFGLNLFRGQNRVEQVFPFPEGMVLIKAIHKNNPLNLVCTFVILQNDIALLK